MAAETNWAGNLTYAAAIIHHPRSVEEVCERVRAASRVRALGTRHCFNNIANTADELVALDQLPAVMEINTAGDRVTVAGGVRYGELGAFLHAKGFALHNLASLPHISVAGAVATATHGSGNQVGNLATGVTALEIVGPEGEVTSYSREKDGDLWNGLVVNLGVMGIATKLSLEIQPTFMVRQSVYENLPFPEMERHFGEITSSGYSVSLFTDWRSGRINQVWVKERSRETLPPPRASLWGANLATVERHPLEGFSAEHCTPQLALPGPWHERLPHFRMGFTPSGGEELQSEYFVARKDAVPALRAIASLSNRVSPLLFVSEIRTIAADALWLSPHYQRESVGIHFTWKRDWPAVREVLPLIEAALAPFDARPHWGKLFTMPRERVRLLYPRLPSFQELARGLDEKGKFRNSFIDTYVLDRI